MPGSERELPIRTYYLPDNFASDGDGAIPPISIGFSPDDGKLLHNIGNRLAKADGLPTHEFNYKLDKYPSGYSGWSRPRTTRKAPDRRTYGHPGNAKFFSSAKLFAKHLLHIKRHGSSQNCNCNTCVPPSSSASARKRRVEAFDDDDDDDEDDDFILATDTYDNETASQRDSAAVNDNFNSIHDELNDFRPTPESSRLIRSNDRRRNSQRGAFRQRVDVQHEFADEAQDNLDSIVYDSLDQDQGARGRTSPGQGLTTPSRRSGPTRIHLTFDQVGPTTAIDDVLSQAKRLRFNQYLDERIKMPSGPSEQEHEVCSQQQLLFYHRSPNIPRQGETIAFRTLEQSIDLAAQQPMHDTWDVGFVAMTSRDFTDTRHVLVQNFGQDQKPRWTNIDDIVPLHAIPGLGKIIDGIFEERLQALTCSFSLLSAYHVKAERQQLTETLSTLSFHGIYVENELILLGDYVRLLPRTQEQDNRVVTDIMLVKAIQLHIVQPDNNNEEGKIACHVSGRVLTIDRSRAFQINGRPQCCAEEEARTVLGEDSDTLYWRTNPDVDTAWLEVPFTRILGRYHDANCHSRWHAAVGQMFRPRNLKNQDSHLSFGLKETLMRRNAASQHAESMHVKTWSWHEFHRRLIDVNQDVA